MNISEKANLNHEVEQFLRSGFSPRFGKARFDYVSRAVWRRFRELGTELWFDTGSMEDAEELWTQEFSALTTNNTLLNKVIQTGRYDSLIMDIASLLESYPELSDEDRMLEFAFMLNCWHGLRLVERFEGYVSVEEHTCMSGDVNKSVEFARRYFDVCPERFIVKIPFTPAGLLAARKCAAKGIPVNHTLGFSARQNYVMARIAKPAFVNVFLGRLNCFIADNNLGSGCYVGEKATLASQAMIREVREKYGIKTRQIAASIRDGRQVEDLAGVDVMTIPPAVVSEFLGFQEDLEVITDQTGEEYIPAVGEDVDTKHLMLDTLWNIDDKLVRCVDLLANENLDTYTPDDLVDFFSEQGCGDLLVRWSDVDNAISEAEGKIPRLADWHEKLMCGVIGLDSLMNLAGLNSFATDQKAMDERVKQVLASHLAHA